MLKTGRPASALAPQAAALIRHISAARKAGVSPDAAAAFGLVCGPASDLLDLTPEQVERLLSPRTRRVRQVINPPLSRATAEIVRSRLALAAELGDRDVAILTVLDAERVAAHAMGNAQALRAAFDGTAWIGDLAERDELGQHLNGPGVDAA